MVVFISVVECLSMPPNHTDEISTHPYHPGDVLKHKCSTGFEVVDGKQNRMCLSNGNFDGEVLICQCKLL